MSKTFALKALAGRDSVVFIIKDRVSDPFGRDDIYHYVLVPRAKVEPLREALGSKSFKLKEFGERLFSSEEALEDEPLRQKLQNEFDLKVA